MIINIRRPIRRIAFHRQWWFVPKAARIVQTYLPGCSVLAMFIHFETRRVNFRRTYYVNCEIERHKNEFALEVIKVVREDGPPNPTWRGITNTPRHFLQNFEPPTTFSQKRCSSCPSTLLFSTKSRADRIWRRRHAVLWSALAIRFWSYQVRTLQPLEVTTTECSACATIPPAISVNIG